MLKFVVYSFRFPNDVPRIMYVSLLLRCHGADLLRWKTNVGAAGLQQAFAFQFSSQIGLWGAAWGRLLDTSFPETPWKGY